MFQSLSLSCSGFVRRPQRKGGMYWNTNIACKGVHTGGGCLHMCVPVCPGQKSISDVVILQVLSSGHMVSQ